jgi:hypothetical protein
MWPVPFLLGVAPTNTLRDWGVALKVPNPTEITRLDPCLRNNKIKNEVGSELKEVSMPTDSLLVQILLTRSEAQLLFDVLPSTQLQSNIEACDVAIDYLSGQTLSGVRRYHAQGRLGTPPEGA